MNAQLGEFLRSRRGRLDPDDVGLVQHGRRRVPGLRREEVAQLAGVSADYYTRLEQGRGRQVSDAVLDAISRALRLNPTEHSYLYDLARPQRDEQVERPVLRPTVQQLLESLRDVPAIVVDYRMMIVGSNALGAAAFGITDDPRTRDRARFFWLDPAAREFFVDWAGDAETITAELRLQTARHPGDRWLAELVGELSIHSEEFRTLWADHTVREKTQGRKKLNHPLVGELNLAYERLDVAQDSELSLITYLAAPGSPTAERLALLASWTAAAEVPGMDPGARRA
ncbi:helix-turn-helix domain-containing protein [Kribbella endophytica]